DLHGPAGEVVSVVEDQERGAWHDADRRRRQRVARRWEGIRKKGGDITEPPRTRAAGCGPIRVGLVHDPPAVRITREAVRGPAAGARHRIAERGRIPEDVGASLVAPGA